MSYNIQMLPKQIQFLKCQEREKLFIAGIASGKTRVGCWWATTRALQGRVVIVSEPTFGMCKKNLIPTFNAIFGQTNFKEGRDFKLNKTDLEYTFPSGGTIYLCSADAPDRLRGINAHDGLMDEFGQHPDDEFYKILVGRLRNDRLGQLRGISTPTPIKWVKDWIKSDEKKLIRQTTIENYLLPPEYIQSLKDTYGEGSPWYRQEVLGELVDFSTGLIEGSKINILGALHPFLPRIVRAWDFAHADKKSSDYTASVLMSTDGSKYIIHDVTHFKGQYSAVRDRVIQTMLTDPPNTTQYIENTMGGMVVRSELMTDKRLHRVPIMAVNAVSDKIARALPVASRIAQGMVHMVRQPWNRGFIDELNSFGSTCEHDDQVDALAHAYNCIAKTSSVQEGIINL